MSTAIPVPVTLLDGVMNDGESNNFSDNAHMNDVLTVRLSRRQTLKGGISVTATAFLVG